MRVSLVAGFGAGLAPDLPLIASLQFAEVRRDVTVEHIKEYAEEFVAYPNLHVLCILRSALNVPAFQVIEESAAIAQALVKAGLEHRSGIEIGNEPNLTAGWAKDPKKFQAAVNACAKEIRAVSPFIDVVSGGVSNTGSQQQAWLKALVNGLDPAVVVGYHTYRLESADTPQTGFTSRAAEQAALLAILGTRRHVNTETGWNSLKHTVRYGSFNLYRRTVQLTEAQVADYVRREFQIAKDAGCESIALYQLNDELTDNGQGFGIRRPDGSVKPVAAIPAEFAETPPEPPMPPHKYVRIGVNGLAAGVIPTGVLRLDAGSVEYAGVWDGRFTFELPGDVQPWGATVIVKATGYVTVDNYRFALTPVTRDWGGVNQDVVNVDLALVAPLKKPLPPIPTRAQVCAIKMQLQGLTYQTRDYGPMPGVFFWSVYEDRKTSVFPAHRAVGDTHLPVGISGSYNEPNTVWPPEITKGGDLSNDLPAFKRQIREVIEEGLFVDIPLSGDGDSVRTDGSTIGFREYNDPVGSTYGYEWLTQNLVRILKAVRGDADSDAPDGEDLTPYCIFRPGWDGVFYGWSEPNKVKLDAFGKLFRSVLPAGYLAIEHNTGHIPAGEGVGDWQPGGCMVHYDTLLTEFDAPLAHNDNVWQIAARTLGPVARGGTYVRPPDQPATDDPGNPPWYLQGGTARGPYFVVAFEYDAYHWSRKQISLEQVQANRAYLTSVGYRIVC